jgi:hypothetical protein
VGIFAQGLSRAELRSVFRQIENGRRKGMFFEGSMILILRRSFLGWPCLKGNCMID